MFVKQKKPFVYMDYLKSNRGFTLLSMITALSILLLLLPLFSQLIKSVNFHSSYHELSIKQFFIFFRNEFIAATNYEVTSQKIILYLQDGRTSSFEMYNNLIVRRVDGGYEVYLRDIKDLTFKPLPYGVKATIISSEGDRYEKTIVFYE